MAKNKQELSLKLIDICSQIWFPGDEEQQEKKIKELIKAGANVNYVDKGGRTPIIWAAKAPNINAVKILIKEGAMLNSILIQDKLAITTTPLIETLYFATTFYRYYQAIN